MSPAHVRMARAGLNWTLKDLEIRTGVNKNTISRYEAGAAILSDTLQRIERVFKAEGVLFMEEDEGLGPGVRLPIGLTDVAVNRTKPRSRQTKSEWPSRSQK